MDLLNSPSVLLNSEQIETQPPVVFYPDNTSGYMRLAVVCLISSLLLVVMVVVLGASLWFLVAPFLVFAGAWHFFSIATDRKPVLRLFPGKGLKSDQWRGGVGLSLLQGVDLQSPDSNNARLVLQLRPGMPWPGKKHWLRGALADTPQGRELVLRLNTLKPTSRLYLQNVVTREYLLYRARRGMKVRAAAKQAGRRR